MALLQELFSNFSNDLLAGDAPGRTMVLNDYFSVLFPYHCLFSQRSLVSYLSPIFPIVPVPEEKSTD